MGVTITSKKAVALKVEPKIEVLQAINVVVDGEAMTLREAATEYVDVAGKVEKLKQKLKPLEARSEALKDGMRDNAEAEPAEEEVTIKVDEDVAVVLTAKPMKVVAVDKELLRQMLGDDTFMELAEVPITAIRKYLNPKQLEAVLSEERTGKRTVKIKK